ncbi:uncharacterized protein BO66DRAFT_93218 [Aspergillus aculeatinus CBS 121060]|uniref:Uncharacterized protein n=1 Tax=Aspergillus aculeatinus CBS 121060 TaxID=1448322 RepID=A0ACD1H898_9EURO|nr:hypothetical protein BO66DRAFT_93218 [Aspergillus aculeatinus CBS 121060]RAH69980.1 hypothetical protein BO66DRAFT_93218 [Aspergillus aculeatinus CBS 121060]
MDCQGPGTVTCAALVMQFPDAKQDRPGLFDRRPPCSNVHLASLSAWLFSFFLFSFSFFFLAAEKDRHSDGASMHAC